MDVNLFFPQTEIPEAYAHARKICDTCLVKQECLKEALAMSESFGMWGGLTPQERDRLINRRGRKRKVIHTKYDCVMCGKEFMPKQVHQKTCSKECSEANSNLSRRGNRRQRMVEINRRKNSAG